MVDLHPDVVLMVDSGVWSLRNERVDGRVLQVDTRAWDTHRLAAWQNALDTFAATGARVVVPTLAYTRARSADAARSSSVFNPTVVDHANEDLGVLVARNPGRVKLVDLRTYVCPNGRYQEGLKSIDMLRPDGVHYGTEGSDLVGRWLAPQLAAAAHSGH